MKKLMFKVGTIILSAGLLVGCSSVLEEERKEPVDAVIGYKNTYIGDTSSVLKISYILPAGEYVKQLSLHTKEEPYEMTVDYGLKEEQDISKEDFEKDWSERNTKKVLLNNAISYFVLINNVGVVHLNVETTTPYKLTVTREDIESFVGKDVRTYADDAELWKKEIEKDIIENEERVDEFYKNHSLQ